MLFVDTREPPMFAPVLTGVLSPDVEVKVGTLDCGDYVIRDRCVPNVHYYAVERKTASDLLGSLGKPRASDGVHRLQSQVERMSKEYEEHGLILEGPFEVDKSGLVSIRGRKTGWHHAAVQMMLFSFQVRFQTRIHWTPTKDATVDLLRILAQRAQKGCVFGAGRTDSGNEAEA